MIHVCEIIYSYSSRPVYGLTEGVCRITGNESKGIDFDSWVKPTFTDHAFLKPGNIISNEALFCFDESSTEIQQKTQRDKQQRFRTYSHFVHKGAWHCLTKADKSKMVEMLPDADVVCITDTGQKHILFKNRVGMWQLDEIIVPRDIDTFKVLHSAMMRLLQYGFTQEEIKTGGYSQGRLSKVDIVAWKDDEYLLRQYRGTKIFTFTSWLMYTPK